MNRFILSEEEKERILTLHESAAKRHYLSEQVVTDHDSKYDYKKEGGNYFYKSKGSDSWKKSSGDALESIKTRVFDEKPSKTTKSKSKTTTSKSKSDLPFKTKEEGDKFREWMNKYYPKTSKKLQLDPSGSYNNSYIRRAWVYLVPIKGGDKLPAGDVYMEKVLNLSDKGSDKSFSFFNQGEKETSSDDKNFSLFSQSKYETTPGEFVIPFVFPEYEPKIDNPSSEGWLASISRFVTGGNNEKTYGKLGHAGIATVESSGNVRIFEFGRYEGSKKGYGITKTKNLGKIAKISNGQISNIDSVIQKIKSNTQGKGPSLKMECSVVPVKNVQSAISYGQKVTSKPYEALDFDSTDSDANCSTYAIEVAKNAGVPLGDYCFPNPTAMLGSFKKYSIKNVTI